MVSTVLVHRCLHYKSHWYAELIETFTLWQRFCTSTNQKQQLSHVLVADESSSFTHTRTRPHITTFMLLMLLQPSRLFKTRGLMSVKWIWFTVQEARQRPCRVLLSHPAPKSILPYTTARVTHVEVVCTVLRRMRSNVCWNHGWTHECVIIFFDRRRRRRIYEETMHSNEHPYIHDSPNTGQKKQILFIWTILSNIEDFDKFLLLDSDLEFSGFPVQEFFEYVRMQS